MTSAEKKIHVSDTVTIADLTVDDQNKRFYFLFADVPEEEHRMILKFCPDWDDEDPKKRAKRHVENIIGIPGKENVLHNIQLINYTVEEAEKRGLLHPPGYIEHIPIQ